MSAKNLVLAVTQEIELLITDLYWFLLIYTYLSYNWPLDQSSILTSSAEQLRKKAYWVSIMTYDYMILKESSYVDPSE